MFNEACPEKSQNTTNPTAKIKDKPIVLMAMVEIQRSLFFEMRRVSTNPNKGISTKRASAFTILIPFLKALLQCFRPLIRPNFLNFHTLVDWSQAGCIG